MAHKISILGLGYVGFPLLLSLAKYTDHEILGFDISTKIVKTINAGGSPIIDPLIDKELVDKPKLKATSDPSDISDSNIYFICVPTPVDSAFEPDYSYVISAAETIAKYLKKGDIVVLESTVNPGTSEEIVIPAIEEVTKLQAGKDYDVVHTPERINPGDPNWNVTNLPRNIGGTRVAASEKIRDLYAEFINADLNVVSSLKVAEASKIVENSFRDVNIAFVNELAQSFDAMGIDLIETIEAASSKFSFVPHWPGPGVGGHCIAVDPYYLIRRAKDAGFTHNFMLEAREVNNGMPKYTVNKFMHLLNQAGMPVKGTSVAFLGLSYKPEVGDLRESPALKIKAILEDLGAELQVFDPFLPDSSNVDSLEKALDESTAVFLATHHNLFTQTLTPEYLSKKEIRVIMDSRNCLDDVGIKNSGILYTGIGR